MKKVRTHLEDRVLPSYTKGEEIFNMVSHIAGGASGNCGTGTLCDFCSNTHRCMGCCGRRLFMAPRWLCFMRCQVFIMV